MNKISNRRLDIVFDITVILKGIDGLIEIIGGLLLLFISQATLHGLIANVTRFELASDDKHAFITTALTHLDHSLTAGSELFVALYLLVHGIVKVVLVVALLQRKYHYYPVAIVIFVAFILYQAYVTGYTHSVASALLTILDIFVAVLTYMEYKRHTAKPLPTT
jgi:uncharacterized membrane protein